MGLCTVLVTEYGEEGNDGLLSSTARCVLKEDPMELPEALTDPGEASNEDTPALSDLFTRLCVPAGAAQTEQVVNHLCWCAQPCLLVSPRTTPAVQYLKLLESC